MKLAEALAQRGAERLTWRGTRITPEEQERLDSDDWGVFVPPESLIDVADELAHVARSIESGMARRGDAAIVRELIGRIRETESARKERERGKP